MGSFKILTDKPTRNRPIGRSTNRWEVNIRRHIKGICINTSNRDYSAQDRDYWRVLVNTKMNLQVPLIM
jgi:hypothetical protein